eukprot:CAMPEP_0118903152 /NCGR_PEP_ID=MMETSP1166-20130328/8137_1 /TAXON_ID=1104430 /ORGANISM="Chrysoreinhardia sp, Strain CCMP3193" /LENGTH=203 /DNA_ID=CAMNT_0006842377 /DNA_START=16 /DNA_END=627 /DNA_ORIENTATION=+
MAMRSFDDGREFFEDVGGGVDFLLRLVPETAGTKALVAEMGELVRVKARALQQLDALLSASDPFDTKARFMRAMAMLQRDSDRYLRRRLAIGSDVLSERTAMEAAKRRLQNEVCLVMSAIDVLAPGMPLADHHEPTTAAAQDDDDDVLAALDDVDLTDDDASRDDGGGDYGDDHDMDIADFTNDFATPSRTSSIDLTGLWTLG